MGKSQIKSRCQPNDNSSRLYSLCEMSSMYIWPDCHDFAKISDGTITKINSVTQLQYKNKQSNHYSLTQITKSCDLFKSSNQIT